MIQTAAILPTGDEIRAGIVSDTDSSEVLCQLVRLNPQMRVVRYAPICDREDTIAQAVTAAARDNDLVILIGGSGGGHRFSSTLGKDYTHTALEMILPSAKSRQLFGKNGHLWCKLVCGRLGGTLVINLPGPFVEAQAAMKAFCGACETEDEDAINSAMAQAVIGQYPTGAETK